MRTNNILISGAAGGIGAATARLFAEKGYYVGLLDINEGALQKLAKELGPDRCCYFTTDVTRAEACEEAVKYFVGQTGGSLKILFNNAGIIAVGILEEIDLAMHRKIVEVNLMGPLNLSWHALPYLKQTACAHIITTASISALHGNPELVSYSASKRALLSFTESLDMSLAGQDIAVSDILPMFVRTPMVTDYKEDYRNLRDSQVRLEPEDVARTVWKAVKGRKLRYYVGADAKLFGRIKWMMPYWLRKRITKQVIGFK